MDAFRHLDTLSALAPGMRSRLRFLPCRDRIVTCKVSFHLLCAGSLHPTAMLILDKLHESKKDGLSIERLAEFSEARGTHGLRFVAEILAQLCNAGYVGEIGKRPNCFRAVSAAESSWRPRIDVLERKLDYLPRTGRLVSKLRTSEKFSCTDIKWWQPPDEDVLYAKESLCRGIEQAAEAFAKESVNPFSNSRRDQSDENLERGGLLLRDSKLSEAHAEIINVSDEFIAHRCYFNSIASDSRGNRSAWVRVFRAEAPVLEPGYSAYFQRAVQSETGFFESMQYYSTKPRF